ncbi:cysteine hydrolase family protein [Flexivirga meconopsidis]|uniref:cysteine hydrolase family protein n=1 Tax=Flexivirga meconopsidis TaxID=2977121 RepID=UPI0022403A03|nr:isochorismatase family cysteine hydrolase [Flexivirga meconopsidis]
MKTALIGLDYIVDIMHPDGKIARAAGQAAERGIVDKFNSALRLGRSERWLNVLVKVGFEPGYAAQPKNSPMFGKAHEYGALDLAGQGTAFHPDLDDELADLVVTKPRISAFYGTRLGPALSAAKVDRVVLAGVSSVWAVQATARDAHDRDFEVVVLEDACAAPTEAEHEESMRTLQTIATITTTDRLGELS